MGELSFMATKTIRKEDFSELVAMLIEEGTVSGVVRKGAHFVYADLESADQLYLGTDYVRTLLPAKKYCFPPQDKLLKFSLNDELTIQPVAEAIPRVLIGPHPCDLHALKMLDAAMGGEKADDHWRERREKLTIIGMDCLPDEHCFCTSMKTERPPQGGFDLFLTDIADRYFVEIATERGQEILSKSSRAREASAEDARAANEFRQRKAASIKQRLMTQPENIPLALTGRRASPVWEELAAKCLGCGSCNTTCATCFCFDVLDRMNLRLDEGVRERRWDGCLLSEFALVASGENFRGEKAARYRHRFYRKFAYLPVRHGNIFCCGCGRCSVNCLPDIANPVMVLNKVLADESG